jgi:putative transposase
MRMPHAGERFTSTGREYEITHASETIVTFSCLKSNNLRNESFADFITFLKEKNSKHPFNEPAPVHMASFPDSHVRQMHQRYELLNFIESRTTKLYSKTIVGPLLAEFAVKMNSEVYAFSTYSRLQKKLRDKDGDMYALLPKHYKKGRNKKEFASNIENIVSTVIEDIYLKKDSRDTAEKCYFIAEAKYYELIDGVPYNERPQFISRSSFYRRIRELSPYYVMSRRHGETKANLYFRCKGLSAMIERPLQRVEADGNLVDIILVDPNTGGSIGRPRLTVFMDVFTRCILSYELTIGGFSAPSLLKAFKKSLNQENGLPGGVHERILVDNGSDYTSNAFLNACSKLQIQVHQVSPRTPNAKPHIERFFRTLNDQLIHSLPGTTYSNIAEKGTDYNPEKHAKLTIDELDHHINKYIKNFYHGQPRRTTSRSPIILWNESNAIEPVRTITDMDADIYCRKVVQAVVNQSRVTFKGLSYTSASLATIEYEINKKRKGAKGSDTVEVYIDDSDLSYVLIKDLNSNPVRFIKAESILPEYTQDLNLYEHELIKKELKLQADSDINKMKEIQLIWVRNSIRQNLNSEKSKHSRKRYLRLVENPEIINDYFDLNASVEIPMPTMENSVELDVGEALNDVDDFDFSEYECGDIEETDND